MEAARAADGRGRVGTSALTIQVVVTRTIGALDSDGALVCGFTVASLAHRLSACYLPALVADAGHGGLVSHYLGPSALCPAPYDLERAVGLMEDAVRVAASPAPRAAPGPPMALDGSGF